MSSANASESNHGRKTMSQEIKHTRVNNPDLLAPIGEFTDNSESWGKATKGCIVVRETKIAIVDNGEFNRNVFPKCLLVLRLNQWNDIIMMMFQG